MLSHVPRFRALPFKKLEPLSNFDIERGARDIPHFRGVFMRDGLPPSVRPQECGVVNLDSSIGGGTHWVAYHKVGPSAIYFDSYGLDPPKEIARYLGCSVRTQTFQLQGPDDVICGHLCLHVLKELAAGRKFEDVVLGALN
jgi:hypothetical protein